MAPTQDQARALHDHLSELHQELDTAQEVSPEARALLEQVMADIQRLLERTPVPKTPHATLRDRVQQATVNLEQSSPTLADAINRLSQTLANMGL